MTRGRSIWALAALIPMIAAPFVLGDYHTYLLTLTCIWAIMALSMGLVLGFVGQINLGQAAFVAIAAYVSAAMRVHLDTNFWLTVPIALASVVAVAALVGLVTLRLRGPFFILVMLAFGEIVRLILANWQEVTNGPIGLRPIDLPEPLLGLSFESKTEFYFLVLAILVFCIAALTRLVRSRTGRMLIAVREDEVLAEFVGIPVMRHKVIGLAVAALVGGIGGLLIGPLLTVVSPSQFTIFASVDMIVMVVVGGLGTLAGPIIGAVFLVYVPELLSFTSEYRPMMMGLVLILVVIFAPRGLVGLFEDLRDRLFGTRKADGSASPTEHQDGS